MPFYGNVDLINSYDFSGKKLLIVDDEPDLTDLLLMEFEALGAEVAKVHNGLDAWNVIEKTSFDCIISDIRMPDGDGLSLLNKIFHSKHSVPIIFISGFADVANCEIFACGVVAKLQKPFDRLVLVDTVYRNSISLIERWRLPAPEMFAPYEVDLHFKSIGEAYESGQLAFGKGGFYLCAAFAFPLEEGDYCRFKINFDEGELSFISGVAGISWTKRDASKKQCKLGFEIYFVEENDREKLSKYMASLETKSFIPFLTAP